MDEIAALHDSAVAAWRADDYDALERLAAELIEDAEAQSDRARLAAGYLLYGHSRLHREDGRGAEEAYRLSLGIFSEIGDRDGETRVMMSMGVLALELNMDVAEARRLYDICIPVVRRSGHRERLAIALANLGEIFRQEGDYRQAMISAQESLEIFRELGDSALAGWQLFNIAHYHSLRREYPAAIENLRASFVELSKERNARWVAMYFDVWIIIAVELQADATAARLLGFVDRLRDDNDMRRLRGMLPWFLPHMERLSKRMPDDVLFALRAEGASLTLDQAQGLAEALAVSNDSS